MQRVMASQMRSHIEYLVQTYRHLSYSCAHFVVEIDQTSSLHGGFLYYLLMLCDSGYFFGYPDPVGTSYTVLYRLGYMLCENLPTTLGIQL